MSSQHLILSLVVLASTAMATAAPTATFSIEGVTTGMTPEEARAAGARLKEKHRPGLTFYTGKQEDNAYLNAYLSTGGKINLIIVAYSTPWYGGGPFGTTIGKDGLTPDALVRLVTERFGPPTSGAVDDQPLHNLFNTEIAHIHNVTAVWTQGDQVMVVRYEQQVGHFAPGGVIGRNGNLEPPSLELRIGCGFPLERMVLPGRALIESLLPPAPIAPEEREKVKF